LLVFFAPIEKPETLRDGLCRASLSRAVSFSRGTTKAHSALHIHERGRAHGCHPQLSRPPQRRPDYFPLGTLEDREAVSNLSQVRLYDSKRLIRKMGTLDEGTFHQLTKALAHTLRIPGVYNHGSRYLHLPTAMLAARDLFELGPVLFEAPPMAVLLRWWRLDFFKRSMSGLASIFAEDFPLTNYYHTGWRLALNSK
jgi:hypothetical protein